MEGDRPGVRLESRIGEPVRSPKVISGVRTKHQFRLRDASQDRQPEIQSSLVRDDFQRIMGQTNNNCRFRNFLHFDKFTTPATFACWKIRFKSGGMYLFTISCGSCAVDQRSGDG